MNQEKAKQICDQFLNTYYNSMANDRASLLNFYNNSSYMSYERTD